MRRVFVAILTIGFTAFGVALLTGAQPIYAATPPDSCFAYEDDDFFSGVADSIWITDYYTHENNNASAPECPKDVDVPSKIAGKTVTHVGGVFLGDNDLASRTAFTGVMSLKLPPTVTTLSQINNLAVTEFTIPKTVKTLKR